MTLLVYGNMQVNNFGPDSLKSLASHNVLDRQFQTILIAIKFLL